MMDHIDLRKYLVTEEHKTDEQRIYEKLVEYAERLKKYATHIKVCGEERNSYSKTDHDATFMRMKKDYMGNDQLLPGYNIQLGLCDEYISVYDIKQYASDMDCFQPLIESFYNIYKEYPEYPVADAGYGSFNNYLYCEEHGMKKYMKFTMFKKECEDKKYNENPYRAVNFNINENGNLICPNNKETNKELTKMHQEVLTNLNSAHGALLRMNRSIQAEGAYGTIKWNKAYTRARRRGLKSMNFEIAVISCGFNLHKFHLKQISRQIAA